MTDLAPEVVDLLAETPLFSGCTRDQTAVMMGCLQPHMREFRKGSYLIRRRDTVRELGIVVSGSVFVRSEDYWGNSNILTHISPGGMFAEAFACTPNTPATVDVVAAEKTEALFMNVARIISTCSSACEHHTRLIRNLTAVLAQRNQVLTQKMEHLTKRSMRDKVLSYLSAQSETAKSAQFEIPFDRQQLADYLSVDRSALSACLSALKQEGIIDYRKNKFELL